MSCLSAFSTEALSGESSFVPFLLRHFISHRHCELDTKLFHRETRLSAPHICYALTVCGCVSSVDCQSSLERLIQVVRCFGSLAAVECVS